MTIPPVHPFSDLFAQLGLPNSQADIALFLRMHGGLADGARLPAAPFWTPSQSSFLKEALSLDSEWSHVVDQLSKELQSPASGEAASS
jgi:hypothetical protein